MRPVGDVDERRGDLNVGEVRQAQGTVGRHRVGDHRRLTRFRRSELLDPRKAFRWDRFCPILDPLAHARRRCLRIVESWSASTRRASSSRLAGRHLRSSTSRWALSSDGAYDAVAAPFGPTPSRPPRLGSRVGPVQSSASGRDSSIPRDRSVVSGNGAQNLMAKRGTERRGRACFGDGRRDLGRLAR